MKYLRKRKIHELAVKCLPAYDIPKCVDCTYKAYGGYEWLSFCSGSGFATFTVAYGAKWIRFCERDIDNNLLYDEVLKRELFDYDC